MSPPRRRRVGASVAAFLVAVATLAEPVAWSDPPRPAAAQTADATGTISLVSQTPFRAAGQPFAATLRVRTSSATAGLEIAVGTYRRLRSRSEFANSVAGRLPTRTPTDLARFPLDALPVDPDGNVSLTLEPRASQDGVYPVRIDLREGDGDVVDGFTTFLTTVPATVEADPLDVAVVLPVHAPPGLTPRGEVDLDDTGATALTEVAGVLTARASVPLTLAPTPETLEALATSDSAADRDTTTGLARAAEGRQVVAAPYVPVELSAMLQGGLGAEVSAQLERGVSTTAEVLGTDPDLTTRVVDERLDERAFATLDDHGVRNLVIRDAVLEPVRLQNDLTLTATFGIAGSQTARGAVADAALSGHFRRDVPPALAAAHLLADLAVLWLDLPGRSSTRRGVVVMPDRDRPLDPAMLDTFLDGLGTNPVFAPVTASEFFDQVGQQRVRNSVLNRSFLPREANPSLKTGAISRTRRMLEAFAAFVAPDNPELDTLDRLLLISQSSDLRASTRTAYLRGVDDAIAGRLRGVSMPERRSITLTAREGELPITITRALDYPVTVVLTLDSDALDFPGGSTRTLELTRQNTTERFAVHARGSGSFPVRVRVSAPQGGLVIAESLFTVRSTAVSGVGIGLSVGAAVFLVVWWASHLRSRRQQGRREVDPEPVPA